MSERTVTTQAELDQAVKDGVEWIEIRSERGVWIELASAGSSTVTAYGSSTVTACGSSTVTAYGSSTVTACGSSTVTACGSSTVTAYGSSTVRAYDSSTVTAYDSSTVTACGSSTVTAYGSSTVRAYDSSTVTACGSSTVTAYGSSTVTACGSSTVTACGSSTVTASSHTAVHLHSGHAQISGGVLIDHTAVDEADAQTWCAYHGVEVADGIAYLYKAVDDNWTTDRGVDYSPGSLPSCEDFKPTDECGNGLHFGPTPGHALAYHEEAKKFLKVGVRLAELQPVTGSTAKAKAPRVVVACVEVDLVGRVIEKSEAS